MSDCLFCRMVSGEIAPDVVRETDRTLAFRDINPQAPTHVLVVPKEHHPTVAALAQADPDLLGAVVRGGAHRVDRPPQPALSAAQPGGQRRSRPPSTCRCTCGTVCPAAGPVLVTTR